MLDPAKSLLRRIVGDRRLWLALMVACLLPPQTEAAVFRIAVETPLAAADVTTHEITSGEVVLGVSEHGGGYINKLFIPGIGDIIGTHAGRYGRGGQVTIRDQLHGGVYNPTQAGFTDRAGTQCAVVLKSRGELHVPARPCALWNGDGKYDFIEWENLAADPYRQDGGHSDMDGIDESDLPGKQAEEITSEFDFSATYQDVMDGREITIPAFLMDFEFRFLRFPGHALRQFREGTAAYDPSAFRPDRSNLAPAGIHPSREDSLTGVILSATLRGDRAVWNPTVIFSVDRQQNALVARSRPVFRAPVFGKPEDANFPLIILSRSKDPAAGPAVGYFFPDNPVNRASIVGRSVPGNVIVYSDVRTTRGVLLSNLARTEHMWLMGVRTFHSGLLNRRETPADVYEAIRGQAYILIGSPEQIFAAAKAIDRRQ